MERCYVQNMDLHKLHYTFQTGDRGMSNEGSRKVRGRSVTVVLHESMENRNNQALQRVISSTLLKTYRKHGLPLNLHCTPLEGRGLHFENLCSRESNEEKEVLVCESMLRSPGKPKLPRRVELETGVLKSLVRRIIKKNKIKFYTSHLVHNLLEDDPDRRVEFCFRIIEFRELDPTWHTQIVFSDESTFYRNGAVNRHNCNYYNTGNPHILEQTLGTLPVVMGYYPMTFQTVQ
ncbi:hypothetical protein J6590_071833 [Homalodisca vitripennis]|nr:hypothetical protein J6590_071833 [Homalodisca vitripennis]